MKKIYLIVASLLLALVGQSATKTVTISMSKDYDDTPLGQWLIDNVVEKDAEMQDYADGDATVSPFVFHLYCDDGCEYNDGSNTFGLYGDMSITCTQGRILALEAEISGYDEDEKVRASVYGEAIYSYSKNSPVGTTRVNGDDEIFTWNSGNSEGYDAITIATSNNCLYFHAITITYEEYTFSTATAPVEVNVRMSKDYDDTPLGQWLIDNVVEKDAEAQDYPDGNATVSPFVFHLYCDDGCEYNDGSNTFGLYGDMSIVCNAGRIVALDADISGYDEDERVRANVYGKAIYSYSKDSPVGTTRINGDDEIFSWKTDVAEGYPAITIATSNNCLYFNTLTITYIPYGGDEETPIEVPDAPTDGIENELVQTDFVDVMNPDEKSENIALERGKAYNVYGFDFTFSGTNAQVPTLVYKTNSDDDVLGEVALYGGDSFTVTPGKTIEKEDVSMTYAVFTLTSKAQVTADKGEVAVNGLTMTWWGDATQSVTFTVADPAESCLAFKEAVIYTDKKVFDGGISSGSREYYIIKNGAVTKSSINLYAESNSDFSLTVGTIPSLQGVNVQNVTIKVGDKNVMADTKIGQYSCAHFDGPFTNKEEIPVELTYIYEGGATMVPFTVVYPNSISYKPNAPFTFKNTEVQVPAETTMAIEVVNTENLPLTYTVSDASIATVDAEGNVTGLKAGQTMVTATFSGNENYLSGTATVTINVVKSNAPITMNTLSYTTMVDGTVALVVENEENLPLTYSVADSSVATVDADGVVTGVKVGETTVNVSFAGNDAYEPISFAAKVSVEKGDAPISLINEDYTVCVGKTVALEIDNAKNLTFKYISGDSKVAEVGEDGVITGVGVGSTTITIAFAGNDNYWGASLTANVTVTEDSGVDTINVDDAEVVYFDLYGNRIYCPAKGMIVIRVEGGKATKMMVK